MLRTVRHPSAKGVGGYQSGRGGSLVRRRRGGWALRLLGSLSGADRDGASPAFFAAVFVAFLVVTAVFFAAIERHDVNLSFDQRLTLGRDTQTFGNRTVYLAESSRVDPVLSQLSHDDWSKISSKIDYVAFVYDRVDLTDVFESLSTALESIVPHGYGIVLFSCGCVVHNVLLQHVSVRFDGMECAMLPGFVFDNAAVRWVDTSLSGSACQSRDRLLKESWYNAHAYKLQSAREEYISVRRHLRLEQHDDRIPRERGDPVAVRVGRAGG